MECSCTHYKPEKEVGSFTFKEEFDDHCKDLSHTVGTLGVAKERRARQLGMQTMPPLELQMEGSVVTDSNEARSRGNDGHNVQGVCYPGATMIMVLQTSVRGSKGTWRHSVCANGKVT